jgi:hypothetical protein
VPLPVLALASLAAILTATGSRTLSPVRFAKKPGWHVGVGHVHACPGTTRSRCTQVGGWAAPVPWRDCQNCGGADRTLASLPRDGIVIYLLLGSESHPLGNKMQWPPRLRAGKIVSGVEGHSSRIGFFGEGGRLHGFSAQLDVYFGRPHPTTRQLARANAELRTARLP